MLLDTWYRLLRILTCSEVDIESGAHDLTQPLPFKGHEYDNVPNAQGRLVYENTRRALEQEAEDEDLSN